MSKAILLLSAAAALAAFSGPVLAQSYEHASASGYEHSIVQSGSIYGDSSGDIQVEGGRSPTDLPYAGQSQFAQAYGARSYESESSEFQSSSSYQSQSYGARVYGDRRVRLQAHHTTDAAGFLTWSGKSDDLGPDDRGHHRRPAREGGPACPTSHGERVLSCRFVSFAPPPEAIHINDADFAYGGGVGPAILGDNGGGGGSVIAFAGGSASASASASAFASASVSVHGHYGGGHWGHGGHPSGCGCSKKR